MDRNRIMNLISACMFGIALGIALGRIIQTSRSDARSVEHGCAAYDPTTGKLVYREDQHGGCEE